jgi:hypothetical protein
MADPVFRSAFDFLAPRSWPAYDQPYQGLHDSPYNEPLTDRQYGIDPGAGNDRGYAFNQFLPFTTNKVGSANWVTEGSAPQFAVPEAGANALKGLVGLGESTQTGKLTPEALATLTMGSMGTGALLAPRGALAAGAARPSMPALAMDEAARMARAKEQGYTIDAYKGAYPYDYNTGTYTRGNTVVDTGIPLTELTSLNSPKQPYAAFLSDSPDVANRFADLFGKGSVFPTKLKFENPVIIEAGGKPSSAFQFADFAKNYGTTGEVERFKGAFKEGSPHDGVIIRNTSDEGTVYVPRHPQQIRSRFATFDPSRRNDPDMLAARAGGVPPPGLRVPLPQEQPPQQPGFRVANGMVF